MDTTNNEKAKYIRLAAITAIAGNAILAVLKMVVGAWANSGALIGDGIDSSTDVLISMITLVVVRIISKPADKKHPWGHGRAETISTVLLSFIIFFAGMQLVFNSVTNLFAGERQFEPSTLALVVTLCSIVGKLLLAWSQHFFGKRAGSAMLLANAQNMASDVLISLGVLVGLLVSTYTGSAYADTIITMLIGLWIIRTAVNIFLDVNLELMDGIGDMEPYRIIVRAVNAVEGADNPHRARIRHIAGFWDIDFDIDVDPKCTVVEAHAIASKVEEEIKRRLENVYDIMIHIEPRGDKAKEAFGLSEIDMSCDDC